MKIECPKCKTNVLEYVEDYAGCEVEVWACTNNECEGKFHVDIEIIRNFDMMQEVKPCNT